jgi:hypothetical protein
MGKHRTTEVAVAVTAVRPEGSVTIGYGTDDAGKPVLFAGDPRMMAAIADELSRRSPVPVTVESWQLLAVGGES